MSTEVITKDQVRVCEFCDEVVTGLYGTVFYCEGCDDYKGVMTIAQWESKYGEVYEF